MPTEVNGQEVHGGMSVVLGFLASLVNLPGPQRARRAHRRPASRWASRSSARATARTSCWPRAARYEQARPWPRLPAPLARDRRPREVTAGRWVRLPA